MAAKPEKISGGCQCGTVRYELSSPMQEIYVCHCSECRKQSSSAFGISAIFPTTAITIVSGQTKPWSRPTAASSNIHCHFCGDCGSRIWHWGEDEPDIISVKGGTLDVPPDLKGASHIWTSSKLDGIEIPNGSKSWPEEPS